MHLPVCHFFHTNISIFLLINLHLMLIQIFSRILIHHNPHELILSNKKKISLKIYSIKKMRIYNFLRINGQVLAVQVFCEGKESLLERLNTAVLGIKSVELKTLIKVEEKKMKRNYFNKKIGIKEF